jgi:O-antigen/teichoic acid export membrane protein
MPSLLKDLFKVFSSNLLVVALGILSGFVVPRLLTIDEYAIFKTFGLYATYVGILHFGFIDGIHLKYGGKLPDEINSNEVKSELYFLVLFQFLISIAVVVITFVIGEKLLIPVAFIVLPTNIITFYLFFFQATRQFSSFSVANILRPLMKLITIFVIVLVPFLRNEEFMIWAQVASSWIVCILLSHSFINFLSETQSIKFLQKRHFNLMSVGVFIMLGNLSSMLFFSMDRWFVKFLLPMSDFAFYSFATSMMGLVMIMIRSVAMTFYPFLSKSPDNTYLQGFLLRSLIILGAFSSSAIFILNLVVSLILPKYLPSLDVIGILLAGMPAIATINCLYVNLFKAKKIERKYFRRVITVAALSFILNCIAVWFSRSNISIAIATTTAFYLWFFISSRDFPGVQFAFRDLFFVFTILCLFFITTIFLNFITGFVVYLLILSLATFIVYRDVVKLMISKIYVKGLK